jgi:phage baseplate assembly protein W
MSVADRLGTDLTVLPHFAADDATAADLVKRWTPGRVWIDQPGLQAMDAATLNGRENLAQAMILRLLTPRGSLAQLGHAAYGSRLHELIGRRKTSALRNLCRAFVLEAVAQEPRVESTAVSLDFDEQAERFDSFVFTLAVQPVTDGDPVALGLEVGL